MDITQTSKTVFLRQLVADIEAEKIGIPVFQRSFVWTEDKVINLFDSINKGYPIGAILLWGREEKSMKRRAFLTDDVLEAKSNVYYILDGRQRLTTFYGCIAKKENKRDVFRLAYNIKEDTFEYPKKESDFIIPISDIFDTFTLIGILQHLLVKYKDTEQNIDKYLDNAKRLNSKLQEYQIVQISLDYCDLDEANIVFSRINAQGTVIKKAEMLQAINYKDGSKLLVDEIEAIQESLGRFNFENLSQDDILNCFFKFVKKDFYSLSFKEMESLDLLSHFDDVKQTIERTVEFLYAYCGIVDLRLLPYTRQFIILTFYFKEYKEYSECDFNELRKWLYYTTYNNSFQNSSIANIRNIAKRFEEFVKRTKKTAIDYQPFEFKSNFDFRISLQSAKSKFLILAMLNRYKKCSGCDGPIIFEGLIKFGGSNAENYFVLTSQSDKNELAEIFHFENINHISESRIKKFGLRYEMIREFFEDTYIYKMMRWQMFLEIEQELWEDVCVPSTFYST